MNPRTTITRDQLVDELSIWTVGLGILTMALAPLAIPIIVLTAVAGLVLLAPVLTVGLLAGLLALPILLLRAGARQAKSVWRSGPRRSRHRERPRGRRHSDRAAPAALGR